MVPTSRVVTMVLVGTLLLAVAGGCGKKGAASDPSSGGKAAKPLKLIPTPLPWLKLTMQAPEGAKVEGKGTQASVRAGAAFGVSIQKDIYGAKGDTLIIPFEKKLLKKKLVDQPDLQIWQKDMGGQTVVLFAMVVAVGDRKFYVQSDGFGSFSRPQVDTMVKAVRTLKAQ